MRTRLYKKHFINKFNPFGTKGLLVRNKKKLFMLSFSFIMFSVYSSFSFPIFITGGSSNGLSHISEAAKNMELAEQSDIDFGNMIILEDNDVLEGEEVLDSDCLISEVEHYNSNDILELNQNRQKTKPQTEEASDTESIVKFSKDDWRLILINKQHSIPEGYEETVPLGNINTMKGVMHCDERIIDDLLAMIQSAKEDGITLVICSPYRDLDYQQMLFNRKINKYMQKGLSYMEAYQLSSQTVTVPNASEHQIGLALDIVTNNYISLDEGFGETKAGLWLNENSYKYGFILRYPKGKEDITGISYEPWHFRYVGEDAAKIIKENNYTLEEFWEDSECIEY